jgi:hypothetical protein
VDEMLCDEVAANLKRAVKSPKPYAWFFCAKGEDGKPVLLVGKRAAEVRQRGKEIRKTAADKKGGRGRVVLGDDGKLVFGLEDGNAPINVVEKLLRLKIATDPGLKKVKGLLQKARVIEGEELLELLGPSESEEEEASEGADLGKLKAALDTARVRSKGAYDAAVARVGSGHAELAALGPLQESAKKARQDALALEAKDPTKAAALFSSAVSLYEEIGDTAEAVGLEDEGEESEGEESEAPSTPRKASDLGKLAEELASALESAGKQIEALKKALVATGDPDLLRIADLGLNALTAGHRTSVQAALLDARGASQQEREAAVAKVAAAASAFLDHLDDAIFEACDDNPFGVKVKLRKTLGNPLRKLAAAA